MSVGRTEMGCETGMSFRGLASTGSVILDEALLLLSCDSSIDASSECTDFRGELGRVGIASGNVLPYLKTSRDV